jgi:hypothetical protein
MEDFIMDFNVLVICISWILTLLVILLISWKIVKPYLEKIVEIRDKEVKNKKYELFSTLSPEEMDKSIDDYIEQYITRYITYKFIANKAIYIKDEEIKEMIKDVTKNIYLDISELYVFYIQTAHSVTTDDELLTFIHSRVTDIGIGAASNFNSSSIG